MLKIELNYDTNIKYSNKNAKLFKTYKKIIETNIIIMNILKAHHNINDIKYIKSKKTLNNVLVLIKSPFHYKNSKSVLHTPKFKFKVIFKIAQKFETPIFLNKNFFNYLKHINNLENICIRSIKINQKC